MAKNMMSVGFAYGGEDKGMGKVADQATEHLGLLGKAVDTLQKILSINKLQLFIESISLSKLGDIADKVADIAEKGRNLTTSLEGQYVAANKSGKALGANFGYSAKAIGKFTAEASSMGIALNVGTDAAGKAIYAWEQGADMLKILGVDSKETAIKMGEVFHLDPSALVFQLKEMKDSLHLSDKEIKAVTDSTLAWGQQTGDVSKAMSDLPNQIAAMQEQAHSLGKTLSGDQVAKFAVSTNQAASVIYSLTHNTEKAQAAAKSLSKVLVSSGKDWRGVFTGTQEDLGDFFKEMSIVGVDVDKQMKLMSEGPTGFIKGMSEMVSAAKKQGKQLDMGFIKAHLEKAIGPEAAEAMAGLFNQGDDAVQKFIKDLPKATDSLGDLSKAGFSTGRTLADEMDLMQSSFVMRLRSTSKAGQNFVADSRKAFKDWGDTLVKYSGDKGPLGMITRKMIEMHQLGAMALIPKTLRPMANVFGTIAKEAAPMIGIMGSLGFRLSMLASPITLIVGALAALAYWFYKARKPGDTFMQTIGRMGEQAKDFFTKDIPKYLKMAFDKLKEFGGYLAKVVPPLMKKMGAYIVKEAPIVVDALKRAFTWFFETALPWLSKNIPPLLAKMGALIKQYAPVVVKGLLDAWYWLEEKEIEAVQWLAKKLWEYLPQIISTVGDLLKAGLGLVKDIILGIWDGIRQFLVEKFPESADMINNVFKTVADFVTDLSNVISKAIDMAVAGWKMLVDFVNDRMKSSTNIFEDIWESITLIVKEKVQDVKTYFTLLWLDIAKTATDAIDKITAPFKAIDGWVDKLFRHSISTDMKNDFDAATGHAQKFSKDLSRSLDSAAAPMAGVTGKVTVGPNGPTSLPAPIRPTPAVSAGDRDASMVNAINFPQWYARYEQIFLQRMAALEGAMAGQPVKGGGRTGGAVGSRAGAPPQDLGVNRFTAGDMTGRPTPGGK